jgi:hypothetical protein
MQQFNGWPRGGQGGGTNERHVTVSEVVNLPLALISNPIADAQAFIAELRAMVPAMQGMPFMCAPNDTGFAGASVPEDSPPFLPGATLGDALDGYITAIAEKKIPVCEHLTIKVAGRLYGFPNWVEMSVLFEPLFCTYISSKYVAPPSTSLVVTGGPIMRDIVIGSGLLGVLADIYADSLDHRTKLSVKSKTKNAGLPARRTGARA